MEERKPNKLWSLVNHFFKSRYINTMLTLEGTWISKCSEGNVSSVPVASNTTGGADSQFETRIHVVDLIFCFFGTYLL